MNFCFYLKIINIYLTTENIFIYLNEIFENFNYKNKIYYDFKVLYIQKNDFFYIFYFKFFCLSTKIKIYNIDLFDKLNNKLVYKF